MIDRILIDIGISLGSSILITIAILKYFGQKIFENQLEKSKERLRFKLETEFDRISKIHQKEFEILPDIWNRIIGAVSSILQVSNPIQREYNIETLKTIDLDDFLKKTNLTEREKQKVKESDNKNKTFHYLSTGRNVVDAINKIELFHAFLLYNKIFLELSLFNILDEVDSSLIKCSFRFERVLIKKRINFDLLNEIFEIANKEIKIKIDSISKLIQERLHFDKVL